MYIVNEISKSHNVSKYPTLENCFLEAVSLPKHVDIDQYKYSGYGIRFDRKGEFPFGKGFGRNCVIFEVDMSSSVHVNYKKKDILFLGDGPTQELDGTTLTAEKLYPINLTENIKKFCLSSIINGIGIIKFKAKDSKIVATPLRLGKISKDFSVDNMKKTGLNGYVNDVSIDYDTTAVDDILDIHKYLMEKSNTN